MDGRKAKDLTGQKFGRLTVVERSCNSNKDRNVYWICRCECGNYTVVQGRNLRNGKSKSCGCFMRDYAKHAKTKHGLHKSRLYRIWYDMKKRCYSKTESTYEHYGGRGITICSEWLNDFMSFYSWAMSNGYADNLTIDRIDVNGNYEPSNCRWATMKEQGNNKRTCIYLTHNNETHTLTEWAEITGLNPNTLYKRIRKGWSVEKALTEPVKQRSAIKAVNK